MPSPTITPAPERSLAQRLEALKRANEVRVFRADLKRELKRGRVSIHDLLLDEDLDERLATAKIIDLLLATPKYGRVKAHKVLQQTRVSPSKTLGGMTGRQKTELAAMLRIPR